MAYVNATSAKLQAQEEDYGFGQDDQKPEDSFKPLAEWIVEKYSAWRSWRVSNYSEKWDSYERLWRGEWSSAERMRDSERSKIVSPALSEAVENGAAEIEEATFGRGDYFDLKAPFQRTEISAAVLDTVRGNLKEDLGRTDFATNAAECILNSAVYGTGIGEIVVKEFEIKVPQQDPTTGIVSSKTVTVPYAALRSVNPRNFIIDPNAKTVDEALGVMVEEYLGDHIVSAGQLSGAFRDIEVGGAASTDDELDKDKIGNATEYEQDRVHVVRYYGMVPKRLLFPKTPNEQVVDLFGEGKTEEQEGPEEMVEAIVVVANQCSVLKAEENPYIMKDRPIVAFPWDVIPGKFFGRGICEKGINSQKILDAEIRARLDTLALTTIPMMGMDASRLPRGFKFEIAPGKSVLTNGNPSEILQPFKFGQLDPNHWQNAAALQQMVQQATGSVNGTGMAQGAGDARTGAMSMAMGPIIKRYKRTMIHFIDRFLMPAIEKVTYRNMQYQPKRYPAIPLQFVPASTMGIMQREYETSQLTALLSTMTPNSPEHRAILKGIVGNTSIANRDQVIQQINQADQMAMAQIQAAMQAQGQPQEVTPLQQAKDQLELLETQAKIRKLTAEAAKLEEEAKGVATDNQLEALRIATKGLYAVDEKDQAAEFEKRYKLAQLALKEAEIQEKRLDRESNEKITTLQMTSADVKDSRIRQLESALNEATTEVVFDYDELGRPIAARPKIPTAPNGETQ